MPLRVAPVTKRKVFGSTLSQQLRLAGRAKAGGRGGKNCVLGVVCRGGRLGPPGPPRDAGANGTKAAVWLQQSHCAHLEGGQLKSSRITTKQRLHTVTASIAFYPAMIALALIGLGLLIVWIEYQP